ncbi:glycosyltransferase family 15 protein [Hymenopellis radicata]|nr:glycosyltransferase family 15 protein [Hymenopellis radicata]
MLPIMTPRRFVSIVLVLVVSIHYILSMSFEGYGHVASLATLLDNSSPQDEPSTRFSSSLALGGPSIANSPHYHSFNTTGKANATFVLLARNSDINGVAASMQSVEDRFNKHYNYPWVLLNDEPFTQEFIERVSVLTRAPISFGLIPTEHWRQPDWIDEDRALAGRQKMMAQRIIYADASYRNMCRFNSGFFFRHELLQPYRYYWRPDIKFFCDIAYDPFVYMQEHEKIYSFTVSLLEWEPTIPTLWSTVKEFIALNPNYVDPQNAMDYLSNDGGDTYNLCHFWSNFEIADLDFWRSERYQAFFDFLEAKGGFYYERWGDAPVHSIAAALFARRDQIHFFRDIGYKHEHFQHCPQGDQWAQGRCSCDPNDSFDYAPNSCVKKFEDLFA